MKTLLVLSAFMLTVGCVSVPSGPVGYINYIRNIQPPKYYGYTDEEIVSSLVGGPHPPGFIDSIIAEEEAKKQSGNYSIGSEIPAKW